MSEHKKGHDTARLESRIRELGKGLGDFSDDGDFEELLKLIHQPGWTTPAEFALVMGIVESLHSHMNTMVELKQVLISGSRAVAPR